MVKIFIFLFSFMAFADDSSIRSFDKSCREFSELMTAENKLLFLRSNDDKGIQVWKAVICLNCSKEKESKLIKVIGLKDQSISWHFDDKNFLEIDEKHSDVLAFHNSLSLLKKTCRNYLSPMNEGSHLQLSGNQTCARHEYLRQYLERKFSLDELVYKEIESKKELSLNEFKGQCHLILQKGSDTSVVGSAMGAIKKFISGGLGEYDPVVSKDINIYHREIATEKSK